MESDERWVVERLGYGEWHDYRQWMPVDDATYYATEQEAQAALDALADTEYERAKESHEKDARECVERAAVVTAARAAVAGMPQANIIGNDWRTEPFPEPQRSTANLRVARVTSFQERVAALLADARGDSVDVDDLRRCFEESRDDLPSAARWRSYLPLDCPACGRHRLEYRTNDDGNVVQVKCEKCRADSDDDTLNGGSADQVILPASTKGEER